TLRTMVTNATAFQWIHGTNIPGATSTNYTIDRFQPGDAGQYMLRAWNEYGTNLSAAVELAVLPASGAADVVLWGQDAVVVGAAFKDMTPPAGVAGTVAIA